MSKEFEIVREFEVDASPEEVWEAITNASGAYLWPMDPPEPRVGGRAAFGSTVTAYDPPHRLTVRSEDVGFSVQSLNQLDQAVPLQGLQVVVHLLAGQPDLAGQHGGRRGARRQLGEQPGPYGVQ